MPTTDTTMGAILRDTYGDADVLRLAHIPRPEATDAEVVVRVHAAGLDRGTWHMMTGQPYLGRLAFGVPKPTNPVQPFLPTGRGRSDLRRHRAAARRRPGPPH